MYTYLFGHVYIIRYTNDTYVRFKMLQRPSLIPNCRAGHKIQFGGFAWVACVVDIIQIRGIVASYIYNLPFSFHIWIQIEATLCIRCVLMIPENSFYFLPVTRFLTARKMSREPHIHGWPSTQPNRGGCSQLGFWWGCSAPPVDSNCYKGPKMVSNQYFAKFWRKRGRNTTFSSFLLKYWGRNRTNSPQTWKRGVKMAEHM